MRNGFFRISSYHKNHIFHFNQKLSIEIQLIMFPWTCEKRDFIIWQSSVYLLFSQKFFLRIILIWHF